MCDSTGRTLYKWRGLSSKECFDFLLDSDHDLCCFGLNYDVNNWIKDLNKPLLLQLWQTKSTTYRVGSREYDLTWIPTKEFRIASGKRSVTVTECFGFFQCSFEKACAAWGMPIPPEITEMKAKRGAFTKKLLPKVTAYCLQECFMLAELMEKLAEQCERVDMVPRKWIGTGQLGSRLLEREGVAKHVRPDSELARSEDAHTAILSAYYGGRVEALAQGDFTPAFVYDINSAYPAAACELPSLAGAVLVPTNQYVPADPHAIWHCRWDCERDRLTPFPTRKKMEIYYPIQGDGWYHAPEVRAAICAGFPIEVDKGYTLRKSDKTMPFAFVPEVYEYRRELKQLDDPGERIVKLALNSMYGKLAQGTGMFIPKWQSYYWAGKITAITRARLMGIMQHQTPLMVATDGLVFENPIDIELSDELGGWGKRDVEGFFVVQPGVYTLWTWEGEAVWESKTRGFFAREVDFQVMRQQFKQDGPRSSYDYDSRRFIGLGTALHRKDFKVWREWREESRMIHFMPKRRLPVSGDQLTMFQSYYLHPPKGPITSEPYKQKRTAGLTSEDQLAGLDQPQIGAML